MDRAILTPPFAHSGGDLRIAESAPGIPTARGTDGGRASRPPAGRRGPAYRRPSGHTAPSPRPRPTTDTGSPGAHTERGHSSFYADFFVTRGVRAARNGNRPGVRGGGAAGRALGSCSSPGNPRGVPVRAWLVREDRSQNTTHRAKGRKVGLTWTHSSYSLARTPSVLAYRGLARRRAFDLNTLRSSQHEFGPAFGGRVAAGGERAGRSHLDSKARGGCVASTRALRGREGRAASTAVLEQRTLVERLVIIVASCATGVIVVGGMVGAW